MISPIITIIHPSRSRPEMAFETAKNWMYKALSPEGIQYVLSLDTDEPMMEEYDRLFNFDEILPLPARDSFVKCIAPNKTAVEAINVAMKALCLMKSEGGYNVIFPRRSTGLDNSEKDKSNNLIIVVSDDFDCPKHWDDFLRSHLKAMQDYIVKVDDGNQPWLITLPIMDRVYYNRFGYIYNPLYKHMFCDTEMTAVADMLGKTVNLIDPNYVFRHKHYTTGGMTKDAINEKNDATWKHGESVFYPRLDRNFDLPPEQIVSTECKEKYFAGYKSRLG